MSDNINDLFFSSMDSGEERSKIAEAGGAFIRQKLRELSFVRKILPPVMVTRDDCQVSTDHDGLVKIVEKEPESKAMALSWKGEPEKRYIEGERYEVKFFTISSEEFEKTEQELLAYQMPITKIIEENSVKDIQEIEDTRFKQWIDFAIADSGSTTLLSDTTVEKTTYTTLSKALTDNRLKLDCVLMNQSMWADILGWDANKIGYDILKEVIIDGYKYETLLGFKTVTTIKNDIIPNKRIYGFAAPQFLGNFFVLNQTKFWVDKRANKISFRSWEDIAMGIGNTNAIAEVKLT